MREAGGATGSSPRIRFRSSGGGIGAEALAPPELPTGAQVTVEGGRKCDIKKGLNRSCRRSKVKLCFCWRTVLFSVCSHWFSLLSCVLPASSSYFNCSRIGLNPALASSWLLHVGSCFGLWSRQHQTATRDCCHAFNSFELVPHLNPPQQSADLKYMNIFINFTWKCLHIFPGGRRTQDLCLWQVLQGALTFLSGWLHGPFQVRLSSQPVLKVHLLQMKPSASHPTYTSSLQLKAYPWLHHPLPVRREEIAADAKESGVQLRHVCSLGNAKPRWSSRGGPAHHSMIRRHFRCGEVLTTRENAVVVKQMMHCPGLSGTDGPLDLLMTDESPSHCNNVLIHPPVIRTNTRNRYEGRRRIRRWMSLTTASSSNSCFYFQGQKPDGLIRASSVEALPQKRWRYVGISVMAGRWTVRCGWSVCSRLDGDASWEPHWRAELLIYWSVQPSAVDTGSERVRSPETKMRFLLRSWQPAHRRRSWGDCWRTEPNQRTALMSLTRDWDSHSPPSHSPPSSSSVAHWGTCEMSLSTEPEHFRRWGYTYVKGLLWIRKSLISASFIKLWHHQRPALVPWFLHLPPKSIFRGKTFPPLTREQKRQGRTPRKPLVTLSDRLPSYVDRIGHCDLWVHHCCNVSWQQWLESYI